MAEDNFIQITPFIYVDDLEEGLAFFTEVLGFEAPQQHRYRDYAYLQRESVGLRMRGAQGEDGAPRGNRRFAYYIDVRDVDRLHVELKPKLDTLGPGRVTGPVNQVYGQRELMIVAPDNNLIVFGQAIRRA